MHRQPLPPRQPQPTAVAVLLSLTALLLALSPAIAGPRASSLMRESRTFLKVIRTAQAQVTVQQAAPDTMFAQGARPKDALGSARPATLRIVRGKRLALTLPTPPNPREAAPLASDTLELGDLTTPHHSPELRLLTLALVSPRFEHTVRKHLNIRFTMEVITLDRIGGRMVWAVGDEQFAVWLDRET